MNKKMDKKDHKSRMEKRKELQIKRLSERQIEKGLILVLTGNGKGKTTSSLGMALRTVGHNEKVAIIQFIKGAWNTGEEKALKAFNDKVSWHSLGGGFTWETQDKEEDIKLANKAWSKAKQFIQDESFKLVILDEILIALKLGYLKEQEIIDNIRLKPLSSHVILTGRGATQNIIKFADLVTEMTLIKHPFKDQGVKAQSCIEF
tara:strand:+ start:1514 stop:2125 length:612 start_codon:yes stop_codon:yes gene_type:complete